MPRRKKSNLSQSSRSAKRMRLVRSLETDEERQARLTSDRERHTESRASETFSQREIRLLSDRERHTESRASETFTQREIRLLSDRERHTESRASESFTQREIRLLSDRERHTESCGSETFTQREIRLLSDRERHTESRASETFTQREIRLLSDRERHTESRASETFTQREIRLLSDRERHTESRASETFTQREIRLLSDRERHTASRASETYTQRDIRLSNDRERHTESRASETFTQREIRLLSDRERHTASRASETFTQRDIRLSNDRERHTESRASETFTQRESRLSSQRSRTATLRSFETSIDREERLRMDREHHSLLRSLETNEQRDERNAAARERYHDLVDTINIQQSQDRERVNEIRQSHSEEQHSAQLDADRIRHSVYRVSDDDSVVDSNNEELWLHKEKSGLNYNVLINYADYGWIGGMTELCTYCQARKWKGESAGLCCSSGKVKLSSLQDPPEILKALLNGDHPKSKHFLDNIRAYNSAFQMTSFGAKQITEGGFMPTFKVQGQVYHLIGSLLPIDEPKFLQIYFVENYDEQANIRRQYIPNLDSALINALQSMLHRNNPYINSFKTALESVPGDQRNNYKFVISADKRPTTAHPGRYNAPTTNEVAVLLVDQENDKRDIVLRARDDQLQRINETHRAYDTLQYPLMFCRGEDGYNFAVYNVDPQTGEQNFSKKTSAMQYYSYMLQLRQNEDAHIHRYRALFNQFLVDQYAKIETERLVFIRTNQKKLRAENYVDLRDAMQHDSNAENVGRMVILPTFTGGPRYMHERTQDAFCYVRKYGRPDLFITITTNPKWPEICNELLEGQVSYDRHDIISRVFHLKLKCLMDLLTKEKVFGAAKCHMYSVEWQKRGLPHAHILLWLEEKIRPNEIDKVISAEIPDPDVDPSLHRIVKSHMVHGPCGVVNTNSPCMKDGRCSKKFPKRFCNETITGEDGYPSYRRRSPTEGGFFMELTVRGQTVHIDNRWIVPYSPVLSRTFETHINVESCTSVESIKYICKYVNKGSDQATFAVQGTDRDEVAQYQSGRYISSSEAVWRILAFSIHDRHPTVMHLDVHLENCQRIFFDPDNVRDRLENPRQTTLLAFFKLCEEDQFAKTLTYDEVPSYYTYDKQRCVFNRRRRGHPVEGFPGVFKGDALGRVYTVHPNNGECYYLRLLLHTVRGPTSFAYLRTVEGTEYPTFLETCRALHLLDDDQHWDQTLEEACVSDSPSRLRHLFSVILVFCGLSNPVELWQKYIHRLSEDFLRDLRRTTMDEVDQMDERVINGCLSSLQDIVLSIGGKLLTDYGLPAPQRLPNRPHTNREYIAETNYSPGAMASIVNENIVQFTPEQRDIFNTVVQSVNLDEGKIFFLDSPGGTGKTFLISAILAEIRRQGKIALAVASSGIAATLLPGGKTAHTTFKIPINLDINETPVCAVSRNSDKARVFENCSLIVWDECTMANKKAIEAVDRTLKDIRRDNRAMGHITVLFSGDFRQTLPVVTRGTRADEVNACLKKCSLWSQVQKLHLTVNMRARLGGNSRAEEFSQVLLKLGEGSLPEDNGQVNLPDTLGIIVSTEQPQCRI